MSQYTTGEIAKLCNVSVRTVQFYDTKGVLPPTTQIEGGRRIYSDDDLKKMSLICLFKSLGLSLNSIKEIINDKNKNKNKVLLLLFEEHEKNLENEIETKQKQLRSIELIKEYVNNFNFIPVNSIIDINKFMDNKKKLKSMQIVMILIGIIMDGIQISTLILGILRGIWIPFIIGFPLTIILGIFIVRIYYKKAVYICPECDKKFKPTIWNFIFSKHSSKARKLKCLNCGEISYCVEITV